MVLSNKKLKQKLRAALAESLVISESAAEPNRDEAPATSDPNPKPQSLKQLLDSSAQKPRLSKREKRRNVRSVKGVTGEAEVGNAGSEENGERSKLEGSGGDGDEQGELGKKTKKKKKRKRDEGIEGSGGEVKQEAKKKNKSKKTKKNKNKKKKDSNGVKDTVTSQAKTEEGSNYASAENGREAENSGTSGDDARKVYVGGIPYYSTEDDIRSYFESCGTITENDCMTFPESGKFRGIAIISFKTDAAAKRALALDGADMGGLFLKIQTYRSTRANGNSASKASNFTPPAVEGYNRIYIGNLSWDITEEDLRKFLSGCNISSVRFGMDKETGEFRGYAHVDFSDGVSMNTAMSLDQKVLCGRPVKVTRAIPKKNLKVVQPGAETVTAEIAVEADSNAASPPAIGSGKMRRRTCYLCGEKGHISSACSKNPGDGGPTNSNSA